MVDDRGRIWIALICLGQVCLLLANSWLTGLGKDEWWHLPSGLISLQTGDFSPYSVNPPLTRFLVAIPVWLCGGGMELTLVPQGVGLRSEFALLHPYIAQHGPDVFFYGAVARTAAIPFSVATTVLLWYIGCRISSYKVGLLAAWLWAFSPQALTFGASITPDVTATLFGLWAAWRNYLWLKLPSPRTACMVGFACGLAILSKATWLILPAVLCLIGITYAVRHRRRWRWRQRLGQVLLAAVTCWLCVSAMYEFQGVNMPLKEYDFVSESLQGGEVSEENQRQVGNRFRGSWMGELPVPLPAAYVHGIDIIHKDFEDGLDSYFFGKWQTGGWWYYYLVGIWLKEPLALWILAVMGGVAALYAVTKLRWDARMENCVMVFMPASALLAFVSSQTGFSHHLRYALPFLPCLYFVIAIGVAPLTGALRFATIGLLIWYCFSSVSVVPRSHSFFTEAIGGPSEGWKYLADSNLDWGEDLLAVKKWISGHPEKRPVYILYSTPLTQFHELGITAQSGRSELDPSGPRKPGWWIVFANAQLNLRNEWFEKHEPNEQLTVSTKVFEVTEEMVEQRHRSPNQFD